MYWGKFLAYLILNTVKIMQWFQNNFRDTLVLSLSNFLTCILAGFVVFAYMGFLSKTTGLSIGKYYIYV